MKKKTWIMIVTTTTLLMGGNLVEAAELTGSTMYEEAAPCYENILNAQVSLTITDNNATCYAKVTSQSTQDMKITLTLQKKSGTSWTTVTSWSTSKSSAKICSLSKTKSVSSGSYRVKAVLKCGSETITKYSSTKTK